MQVQISILPVNNSRVLLPAPRLFIFFRVHILNLLQSIIEFQITIRSDYHLKVKDFYQFQQEFYTIYNQKRKF